MYLPHFSIFEMNGKSRLTICIKYLNYQIMSTILYLNNGKKMKASYLIKKYFKHMNVKYEIIP